MRATAVIDEVLRQACDRAGLASDSAQLIHRHATTVYLIPADAIVVRISDAPGRLGQARTAVELTRWLGELHFPAVQPASIEQPLEISGHAVTFWAYHPQAGTRPGIADLGRLLRRLHDLPPPPVALPEFRPLAHLLARLPNTDVIHPPERRWITDEAHRLLGCYAGLDFPLGHGHIHGDAYLGNTLNTADGTVLADWDDAARGPRELDLANTYQGVRYGQTPEELDAFAHAYGQDLRGWPGLPILCSIRDLHTLGSFIHRAAAGDSAAHAELTRRVRSLRDRDDRARWVSG